MVSVYGADKPGIVYRVTKALVECQANITDVTTRVVGQDTHVYIMLLEVEVPPDKDQAAQLERSLKALAAELSVDITVRPLESASL
jgi:glycine cleavage system transcriptional repressor